VILDYLTRAAGGRADPGCNGHVTAGTKSSVLAGLEPAALWGHFEQLTRIARPSGHEEAAIEHVRS
jgi:hypothetical protein